MRAAGRGDILTRNLPVIVVVNLDTSEHVDRGLSDVRVFRAPVDAWLWSGFHGY